MQLNGRKAIVTGGAGSIGGAIARALAGAGADVCVADRVSCEATAADVRKYGRQALDVPTDISRRAEVVALVDRAADAFGRIDILVNAAGVVSFGSAATLDEDEWDRVVGINMKGVFLCCQAVMPHMKAQRTGRIINIGSILAKNGGNARPWIDPDEQNVSSNVAYAASKAGVHTMTFFLARELAGYGVTVNAVAPGPIATAMTTGFPDKLKALIPLGRMGTGDEVAAAVVFLAGDTSSFITGEILDVNGGMWLD
jgi:3-oxoacyl-[acyl-carrier protein] reductase